MDYRSPNTSGCDAIRLQAHSFNSFACFSYWKEAKNKELDLVAEIGENFTPLEVKYHSQLTSLKEVQGLLSFCLQKPSIPYGYVLTKTAQDIGVLEHEKHSPPAQIIRVPVSLFCYWFRESEMLQKSILI